VLRGRPHPRHSPAKPRCCHPRAPLEESQKPPHGFLSSRATQGRERWVSHSCHRASSSGEIRRCQLARNRPTPRPSPRGGDAPCPQKKQRLRDAKFGLSRNPRASLIDCLVRVITVIKSDFRNGKRRVKTHPRSPVFMEHDGCGFSRAPLQTPAQRLRRSRWAGVCSEAWEMPTLVMCRHACSWRRTRPSLQHRDATAQVGLSTRLHPGEGFEKFQAASGNLSTVVPPQNTLLGEGLLSPAPSPAENHLPPPSS